MVLDSATLRQSVTLCPRMSGNSEWPSAVGGGAVPAISANVGHRSMFSTMLSTVTPEGTPGPTTISGTLMFVVERRLLARHEVVIAHVIAVVAAEEQIGALVDVQERELGHEGADHVVHCLYRLDAQVVPRCPETRRSGNKAADLDTP